MIKRGKVVRYTKNLTEDPSSLTEISSLIEGKTIKKAVDVGNEFQIHFSDDYMLRISGTDINFLRIKNAPDQT